MFSIGLSGKRGGKILAVADIASGSAGVAIVETGKNGMARVLVAERATLPYEDRSEEATSAAVLSQLEAAAQKALTQYTARKSKQQEHVSQAYAIIRAPWSHSRALWAASRFPEDTSVDTTMIGALAQEALKNDTGFDAANVFETSVVRVLLNGYPTSRPQNQRAHEVTVSILVSDCEKAFQASVSERISKVFSCPPPTLRSGTRALLSVLRESTILPNECFLVNMTSHGTTLAAVRKGVVAETLSISEGSRSILKKVGGEKMPEETLSLMRLLATDQCDTAACEEIQSALAQAEPALVKVFGEAMAKMSATRRLPNALLISAHEDIATWLSRMLSKIDFSQFTITTQPFAVRALGKEDLANLVTFDDRIKHDTGLSVASALVNMEVQ